MEQMGPHATVQCPLVQLILGPHLAKVNETKRNSKIVLST